MTVSQDNDITIWFSEDLSKDLKENQIKVFLDNNKVKFSVERADSKSTKVIFDIENLKSDSIVTVLF